MQPEKSISKQNVHQNRSSGIQTRLSSSSNGTVLLCTWAISGSSVASSRRTCTLTCSFQLRCKWHQPQLIGFSSFTRHSGGTLVCLSPQPLKTNERQVARGSKTKRARQRKEWPTHPQKAQKNLIIRPRYLIFILRNCNIKRLNSCRVG